MILTLYEQPHGWQGDSRGSRPEPRGFRYAPVRMGSSYTEFQGYGFCARDGLLETWLEALAEVVPDQPPQWLRDAAADWRLQARGGFTGCVSPGLDEHLTSPDRVAVALGLADRAHQYLIRLAGATGHIPAAWLSGRRVGNETTWWVDLDVRYLSQVADAFTALLRGELRTTAATSPVLPRPLPD